MPTQQFMRIPAELRALNQFIVWRYELKPGQEKPTKVPYSPKWRAKASVTDPNTWGSFDDAILAFDAAKGELNGIGFVFTSNDPYCGIDLDATDKPGHAARQQKIYEAFNSYSERSPSGKGLHIIVKAKLETGRRCDSIEIYSSQRFFTMTGDVFHNVPIAERQELAHTLWAEMGVVKEVSNYQGEIDEKYSDEEVINQALSAVNGDKFKILLEGRWQDLYQSQSEADFAFVNIIAFYSKSRNQIARIFRASLLGQREKAQRSDYMGRMLNRAFDKMLPPIDIEGLAIKGQELLAKPEPIKHANGDDSPPNPFTPPPGLLGEIAQFIYAQAPRPVPEIALAGAIAFLAGVTGRAYNISETGLNQYVLLLAETGRGKEAMASGVEKLIAAMQTEVPAAANFAGPADFASGPALLKHLSKVSPCFVSIVGEFGLKMQQMASPHASSPEKTLKRVLLDLYNKSGKGRILRAHVYSQRENNSDAVLAPALTILGESTPSTFYDTIDENVISDGLLPRFTVIEYNGIRVPFNEDHGNVVVSDDLRNRLCELAAHTLRMQHGGSGVPNVNDIQLSPEAQKMVREFDKSADAKINAALSGVTRELWSRAHIKLLKLSALVAVGCNPYMPTILPEHVEWARNIVVHDITRFADKFNKGMVGNSQGENKQAEEIVRLVREYNLRRFIEIERSAACSEQMHMDAVIPHAYLTTRMRRLGVFMNDRLGASAAIKRALATCLEDNILVEIPRTQLAERYSFAQRAYMLKNT